MLALFILGNPMVDGVLTFIKEEITMKNIAMIFLLAFLLSIPGACTGTESADWKSSSDPKDFPLNHQQILKHLRAANEVAKEAVESGHPPFGAVLVAPDGETVLMKQGNVSLMDHAETVISRSAVAQYDPGYLWKCTLVTTFEPCCMCAGNVYWANIGNLVYGASETTLKKLTGDNKKNPTMNLPCRRVFKTGQKPIRVVGPVPELEDELVAPHRAFWKG